MSEQENNPVKVDPDKMEFTIPIDGLAYVEQELEKLNKRAARLKIKPMKLVKIGTKEEKIKQKYDKYKHGDLDPDKLGNIEIPIYLVTLRIEGDPPKLPGYKLIARLDWKEGNPFIAEVPGEETPIKYRTVKQGCDHCHKSPKRNDTFILQDTKTNEYTQVGRNCLADFLGHDDSARSIVNSMQFYKTIREWLDSLRGGFSGFYDEDDEGMGRGMRREPAWLMSVFMPLVVMLAKKHGYKSAAQARDNAGATSTAKDAADIINSVSAVARTHEEKRAQAESEEILKSVTDDHRALVKKMLEKVIETYEKSPDKASTYLFNLYNIAKEGMDQVLGVKKIGLAASIYQFYMREFEKEDKEREKGQDKAKGSEWVGEPGKRMDLKLKISRASISFDTMYGPMSIVFFVDENGNQFTWKTSSPLDGEPGNWFDVKATVKEHGEYKGTKQTVLTRVKVIKDYSAEAETGSEANKQNEAYEIDNEDGKIIAWHGTRGVFDGPLDVKKAGQTDWGFYGKGVYFANSENVARGYALAGNGMLIKAKLDLANPFVMDTRTNEKRQASANKLRKMGAKLDSAGYPKDQRHADKLTNILKKNGYDGMIVYGQGVEYVVFDPRDIEEISRERMAKISEDTDVTKANLTLADLR